MHPLQIRYGEDLLFFLKKDMEKSYDHVNWEFLCYLGGMVFGNDGPH